MSRYVVVISHITERPSGHFFSTATFTRKKELQEWYLPQDMAPGGAGDGGAGSFELPACHTPEPPETPPRV